MRHAILGVGGVGGFVGAILAGSGESVLLLQRPETLARHPRSLRLESTLGRIEGPCDLADRLDRPVDILWVTPKATQLLAALELIPEAALASAVVPLLNGIDHVPLLRDRFGADRVVPGTIAAELERRSPGEFVHRSPFARFGFVTQGESLLRSSADHFLRFGCAVSFEPDEVTLLWRKLAALAPMALVTTASGRSVGEIRDDPVWGPRFEAAIREAAAVGTALGAHLNVEQTLGFVRGAPATLRSSMQKDVAAGRPPEIDAIGGPILRGGHSLGIPVPVTTELVDLIRNRG